MPLITSIGRLTAVRPLWAVEGGRVTQGTALRSIRCRRRAHRRQPARLASASSTALTAWCPAGLDGGQTPVRVEEQPGETAYVDIGAPLATGLHQVDSPAFDRHGNLYVTFSGSRGQQAPVSIFIVRPDGSREPFVTNVEPDVAGVRIARAAARLEPVRRQRLSRRRRTVARRCTRPSLGSRAASRSGRTVTLYVGDR